MARKAPAAASPAAPASPALPDDVIRFLDHQRVQRRLAARTLTVYTEALTRLAEAVQREGVELRAVKPHHVRHWVARLHAGGLGPRSIALHLSAWRGLYRWLGRDGLVALNPVEGVRAPKAPKPLPKALPVDHAVALADHRGAPPDETRGTHHHAALELRDAAIVELLYGCGLRSAELLGLDARASAQAAGWLDLQAGDAHVLGKGNKRRSVPLGGAALRAVQAWLAARETLVAVGEPALFVSQRGTRLTAPQLRVRLKQRALQAGVPAHVHPHMLRHSFASHVLQSSGDLRAVQELLGHANISTTQVYTKLDFQHLAKVYDAAHPRSKRKQP
jgi:integrase/recombinase XerC